MLWVLVSALASANCTSGLVAKQVDARGTHGLACKRGTGRSIRHHELNDIIYRALTRASTSSVQEPPELSGTNGKRPNGLILIPWQRGKSVTWDVTVTDTVADSYLHLTSAKAGGTAENAATRKDDKYVDLQQTYTFIPLAFERLDQSTSNGWNSLRSWAAASQPSATTIARPPFYSSAYLSRCSGSTPSRSLTHCVNS